MTILTLSNNIKMVIAKSKKGEEMAKVNRQQIAKNLVNLRGEKTQSNTAKELGIAQSTYALYETGKRIPSDDIKVTIAEYYGKTVQEIFFDSILA